MHEGNGAQIEMLLRGGPTNIARSNSTHHLIHVVGMDKAHTLYCTTTSQRLSREQLVYLPFRLRQKKAPAHYRHFECDKKGIKSFVVYLHHRQQRPNEVPFNMERVATRELRQSYLNGYSVTD